MDSWGVNEGYQNFITNADLNQAHERGKEARNKEILDYLGVPEMIEKARQDGYQKGKESDANAKLALYREQERIIESGINEIIGVLNGEPARVQVINSYSPIDLDSDKKKISKALDRLERLRTKAQGGSND